MQRLTSKTDNTRQAKSTGPSVRWKRNPHLAFAGFLMLVLAAVGCASAQPTSTPVSPTLTPVQSTPTQQPTDVRPTASITPTLLPSTTPSPTATIVPSATPEGLFYANTFDGPSAGLEDWIVYAEASFPRHENKDPAYTFAIDPLQKLVLGSTTPEPLYVLYDQLLPEASQGIASEMEFMGEGEASLALICRYTQAAWYELGITNGGHWTISLVQGSTTAGLQHTVLAEGDSTTILPGKNKIEASCLGEALTLSVNGKQVGSATDGTVEAGRIAGLLYQDSGVGDSQADLTSFVVSGPDGKNYLDLQASMNSFYFHTWKFLVSAGTPGELSALFEPKATIITEDGRAKITTNRPMRWIGLYPQVLPYNVDISVDVDVERTDPFEFYNDQGIGLVCRWWDKPAAYIDQNTGGYVLWLLRTYVIVTPFQVDEFGHALSVGTAEWSDHSSFIKLLEGTKHTLKARCWNDRIDF